MADLIFRLETCEKVGPYHKSNIFAGASTNRRNYKSPHRHPSPVWEDEIKFKRTQIFGFTDLELARRWWFDVDDLRDWHKEGLRLAVWPANRSAEIINGRQQCAFTRPTVAPLYLPAYAIHEFDENTIAVMVADKFKSPADADSE